MRSLLKLTWLWHRDQPNYLYLLISLILLLTLAPHWRDRFIGRLFFELLTTSVFISSLMVHQKSRFVFYLATTIGALNLPFSWFSVFTAVEPVSQTSTILSLLFYLILGVMILIDVVMAQQANYQSLAGAGCAYLLAGLTFACVYSGLERMDPDCFAYNDRRVVTDSNGQTHTAFTQLLYFSFVTMSTLGYGDITPRTDASQTIAWIQSVYGQFYLAVLVAWLVSSLPRASTGERFGDRPEP